MSYQYRSVSTVAAVEYILEVAMLYQFLEANRPAILALTEKKSVKLAGALQSSKELRKGLPIFFEHLISYLKNPTKRSATQGITVGAADHGKELLRLNYSLSHVVHSYGAMCQAITELATSKNADISSSEFNDLNLCLDIAIASAVSEFQFRSSHESKEREVEHLGFLVHELRNSLSSASIAHEMIKKGIVGTGGSTAKVLEHSLSSMRILIDRSLSEVRLQTDPVVHIEVFRLNDVVDQILLTAQSEAQAKQQTLRSEMNRSFVLETDRQLVLTVIANLCQNALKYSKVGGQIVVQVTSIDENVSIEVQDQCGGLEPGRVQSLFLPFVSAGFNQTGLGLGLTIVQRAAHLLQGKVSVVNNPGIGCVFKIELPTKITSAPSRQESVSGQDSVQPK